jgi:hypothetical protein
MKLYTNFNKFNENNNDISSVSNINKILMILSKVSKNENTELYDITTDLGNPYDSVYYDKILTESNCSINIGYSETSDDNTIGDDLIIEFNYDYKISRNDDGNMFNVEDITVTQVIFNNEVIPNINNELNDYIQDIIELEF